ncbi:MAG: hypothetical protein JJU05_11590 [Verrucomicrobia bacterium]|nr:hypothetical protein [Verrucomicrobiota bacterium]MCH8528576.1 hypothetical protein [Kiritimatiellia bacterium]
MKTVRTLLLVSLTASALYAQSPLRQHESAALAVSGVYRMAEEIRRFPHLIVMEQAGLRFPSYWTGSHADEPLTFRAEEDLLSGDLLITHEGKLVLELTHSTRKHGMEDQLPAGHWMQNTADRKIRFTYTHFENGRRDGEERGRNETRYRVVFEVKGTVTADGKETPFTGEAAVLFSSRVPTFRFTSKIEFSGAGLGFEGVQAGAIQAHVQTLSPTGAPLPPPEDSGDMLMELGF